MSDYAAITYDHPNVLVRYPHRRRLEVISSMLESCDITQWLDYGTGDGQIFNAVLQHGIDPRGAVGYEPVPEMLEALRSNVAPLVSDGSVEISSSVPPDDFTLVTAFEVLEHLPLPERIAFYKLLIEQTTGSRDCLIEVPVEYGPILAVKAAGRMALKGRASEYGAKDLIRTGMFGIVDDHHGRYQSDDSRTFISPHQGFDLRRLRKELEQVGQIVSVRRSPFGALPSSCNQCVIFHLKVTANDVGVVDQLGYGS